MKYRSIIKPDLILGDTILQLTPQILQDNHIKGLVLDVDETLVPFRTNEVSDELNQWVTIMRDQFPIWLVSNNLSDTRIGGIAKRLDLPYFIGARKPSRGKVREAIEAMKLASHEVAMVGDRLFTDVVVGNRLGMFSILVEPMLHPTLGAPLFSLRNIEVWISERLGVPINSNKTS